MDYYTFEMQGAVLDRTKTLGYGDGECNFHLMSKDRAEELGFVKSPGAKQRHQNLLLTKRDTIAIMSVRLG